MNASTTTMSVSTPSGVLKNRFSTEPRRALLTPSASPSLPPPDRPPTKRPRLRSTPSSAISATPSTSNESRSSADVDSARRASTLRVLNVWAQLAERYSKRLDEDDIIDLYSGTIIKDRGVFKGTSKEYPIGHFAGDQDYPDGDQDQEDSEQDDDDNELNALPPSETAADSDAPISEVLRGMPPLSATTDAEDLREFLEAEKKRSQLAGDEDDDDDLAPERLSAIRKALEEESQKQQAVNANQAQGQTNVEQPRGHQNDSTPASPRVPPVDDESEDELALWTRDESTAVYPVVRGEPEQDIHEAEQSVIELTESDSDKEFEAILAHPPPVTRPSSPVSHVRLPHSPPESERGGQSRKRLYPKRKSKVEAISTPETRLCSPLALSKPEVVLIPRKRSTILQETGTDDEVVSHPPLAHKGKGKETSLAQDSHREKTPKSLGVGRGRKRKRIVSSTTDSPLEPPPGESKSSRGKPMSKGSSMPSQLHGLESTWEQGISASTQYECTIPSPSRPSFKTPQPTLPVPTYKSLEPELVQPTPHSYRSRSVLRADPSFAVTHPLRHPSHPPIIFSSPNQGTPGPSLPSHFPPPMDPVQTQQAQYLLAQAMQQLSYLISATMPYSPCVSNPGQPWHPPPHAAYGTPIHHPSQLHERPYHTPSSSISRPPSSPVRSSVSPPLEGRRAPSRGRSKSRGRRVSFKLSNEEAANSREHAQPESCQGGQKNRKLVFDAKRKKKKDRETEEFDKTFRLEDRDSPPPEIARGRTPGPPSRKQKAVSKSM